MNFKEMMEQNHPDDTPFRPEVTLQGIYQEEHRVCGILLDDPDFAHLKPLAEACSGGVKTILDELEKSTNDLSNSEKAALYVFVNHAFLMGMSQSTKIGSDAASNVMLERMLKSFDLV